MAEVPKLIVQGDQELFERELENALGEGWRLWQYTPVADSLGIYHCALIVRTRAQSAEAALHEQDQQYLAAVA